MVTTEERKDTQDEQRNTLLGKRKSGSYRGLVGYHLDSSRRNKADISNEVEIMGCPFITR